jgi:hypothetical protein
MLTDHYSRVYPGSCNALLPKTWGGLCIRHPSSVIRHPSWLLWLASLVLPLLVLGCNETRDDVGQIVIETPIQGEVLDSRVVDVQGRLEGEVPWEWLEVNGERIPFDPDDFTWTASFVAPSGGTATIEAVASWSGKEVEQVITVQVPSPGSPADMLVVVNPTWVYEGDVFEAGCIVLDANDDPINDPGETMLSVDQTGMIEPTPEPAIWTAKRVGVVAITCSHDDVATSHTVEFEIRSRPAEYTVASVNGLRGEANVEAGPVWVDCSAHTQTGADVSGVITGVRTNVATSAVPQREGDNTWLLNLTQAGTYIVECTGAGVVDRRGIVVKVMPRTSGTLTVRTLLSTTDLTATVGQILVARPLVEDEYGNVVTGMTPTFSMTATHNQDTLPGIVKDGFGLHSTVGYLPIEIFGDPADWTDAVVFVPRVAGNYTSEFSLPGPIIQTTASATISVFRDRGPVYAQCFPDADAGLRFRDSSANSIVSVWLHGYMPQANDVIVRGNERTLMRETDVPGTSLLELPVGEYRLVDQTAFLAGLGYVSPSGDSYWRLDAHVDDVAGLNALTVQVLGGTDGAGGRNLLDEELCTFQIAERPAVGGSGATGRVFASIGQDALVGLTQPGTSAETRWNNISDVLTQLLNTPTVRTAIADAIGGDEIRTHVSASDDRPGERLATATGWDVRDPDQWVYVLHPGVFILRLIIGRAARPTIFLENIKYEDARVSIAPTSEFGVEMLRVIVEVDDFRMDIRKKNAKRARGYANIDRVTVTANFRAGIQNGRIVLERSGDVEVEVAGVDAKFRRLNITDNVRRALARSGQQIAEVLDTWSDSLTSGAELAPVDATVGLPSIEAIVRGGATSEPEHDLSLALRFDSGQIDNSNLILETLVEARRAAQAGSGWGSARLFNFRRNLPPIPEDAPPLVRSAGLMSHVYILNSALQELWRQGYFDVSLSIADINRTRPPESGVLSGLRATLADALPGSLGEADADQLIVYLSTEQNAVIRTRLDLPPGVDWLSATASTALLMAGPWTVHFEVCVGLLCPGWNELSPTLQGIVEGFIAPALLPVKLVLGVDANFGFQEQADGSPALVLGALDLSTADTSAVLHFVAGPESSDCGIVADTDCGYGEGRERLANIGLTPEAYLNLLTNTVLGDLLVPALQSAIQPIPFPDLPVGDGVAPFLNESDRSQFEGRTFAFTELEGANTIGQILFHGPLEEVMR